jgi:hypothetical protein
MHRDGGTSKLRLKLSGALCPSLKHEANCQTREAKDTQRYARERDTALRMVFAGHPREIWGILKECQVFNFITDNL